MLTVALATAAFGNATGGVRVAAALTGLFLFVLGLWFVGRSVRRMFGPIGDVMEAAERSPMATIRPASANGGPGEVRRLGGRSTT